ncbi:SIS domain-containing protein [Acidisarcina polymorpha]|uniref:SIS domain-containing protein n=1 Tax=Acidisarcina polymorpha TaxID=2211140 RepID=UPI000DEEF91A
MQRNIDLEVCEPDVKRAFNTIREAFRAKHKLLICGNGGSAADAEHWAGELLKGFRHKRPLSPEDRAKLPEKLTASLQGALPTITLTGFPSLTTAFGHDVDPELTFAQLVWGLASQGRADRHYHVRRCSQRLCSTSGGALSGPPNARSGG